jgi:pimeloyl-ACP methyl ester carboxylesterase
VVAAHTTGLDSPVARRRGFSRRLLGVDLTAGLADLDVPLVVLAGDADRVVPVAESERVARQVRGATLRVFHGAGHMLPLERAAEVASTIAEMATDGRRRPDRTPVSRIETGVGAGAAARRSADGRQ